MRSLERRPPWSAGVPRATSPMAGGIGAYPNVLTYGPWVTGVSSTWRVTPLFETSSLSGLPGAAWEEIERACSHVGFLVPLIDRILSPTSRPLFSWAAESPATMTGFDRKLSEGRPTAR